jgi:hypothetical protein
MNVKSRPTLFFGEDARRHPGHQAQNACPHAGIQVHSDERNGKTDVPAISNTVVRKYGGGVRRGSE